MRDTSADAAAAALSGTDNGPVHAASAELLWRRRPAIRSALVSALDCIERTLRNPKLPHFEKREALSARAQVAGAISDMERAEAAANSLSAKSGDGG